MPASRRARAMIFAPRSCPSRPGLATTTRILRAVDGDGGMRRALYGRALLGRAPLRLEPVLEVRGQLVAVQRDREVVALAELAVEHAQPLELLHGLDALGDRLQAHPAPELDDGPRQRAVGCAARDGVHEALVDLQ